ncbi:MAG: hypothetical protein ABFD82_17950 [Syntrophaceae bacterium]
MSLILDALKKLEQETAARKEATEKVAAQILRSDHVKPKHKRMVLLAIASAIAGAMVSVALVGGFSGLMKPPSPVSPASTPASPPVSQVVPVAAQPSQVATLTSEIGEKQSPNVLRSSKERTPTKQPEKQNSQQQIDSLPKQETKTHNKVSAMPKKSSEDSAPSFTVSGIIWYEERSASRAVVNEMVVREGDAVNGAKIVKIHPDRVRFSNGKELFDVSLGKAP